VNAAANRKKTGQTPFLAMRFSEKAQKKRV
jgi:hypothetical protein